MKNIFILLSFALMSSFATAENYCRTQDMKHGLFSIDTDGSISLLRMLSYPKNYPHYNYDKLHTSFDGSKLLFLRCFVDKNDNCQCDEYKGAKEIIISDFDGQNEVVVSRNLGGFNDYPNWSPDNQSVVYMHSKGEYGGADLYHYDITSRKTSQITDTPYIQESDNFWNSENRLTVVVKD